MSIPLDTILQTFGLAPHEFDLVLLGDGSGTTAEKPCGWAVLFHDIKNGVTKWLYGGTSNGTNNYSELSPYLAALWLYEQKRASPKTKVLIISDSEVTVKCGQGIYSRRANASLWASIEWFEKNGYEILWKHINRCSNEIAIEADLLAGRVRKALESLYGAAP